MRSVANSRNVLNISVLPQMAELPPFGSDMKDTSRQLRMLQNTVATLATAL
jgi:hypothetical protein